ncbi:unnamed protein product [Moneuplotes crassus]|uniref:Uncharacterized protein n=1 Tax=Euplotes crassus TaxID=5936 RepID=A0AAD2D4H3_EUPCR|nr:unnamed protein product [Moneuplotes crassus]
MIRAVTNAHRTHNFSQLPCCLSLFALFEKVSELDFKVSDFFINVLNFSPLDKIEVKLVFILSVISLSSYSIVSICSSVWITSSMLSIIFCRILEIPKESCSGSISSASRMFSSKDDRKVFAFVGESSDLVVTHNKFMLFSTFMRCYE